MGSKKLVKILSLTTSALVGVVATAQEITFGPSFDCAKVSTGQERLICGNKELSELDVKLSIVYRRAIEKSTQREDLKLTQRDWRKFKRDSCADVLCIKTSYEDRISDIERQFEQGIIEKTTQTLQIQEGKDTDLKAEVPLRENSIAKEDIAIKQEVIEVEKVSPIESAQNTIDGQARNIASPVAPSQEVKPVLAEKGSALNFLRILFSIVLPTAGLIMPFILFPTKKLKKESGVLYGS